MAKAKAPVEIPADVDVKKTYNEHNHETAQASDVAKQCQCDHCKAHRGE